MKDTIRREEGELILDRIRLLCKKNGISISQLEKELGFGNGSIAKHKATNMKSERLQMIAERLNTTVDYLMCGEKSSYMNIEPILETMKGITIKGLKTISLNLYSNEDVSYYQKTVKILNDEKKRMLLGMFIDQLSEDL